MLDLNIFKQVEGTYNPYRRMINIINLLPYIDAYLEDGTETTFTKEEMQQLATYYMGQCNVYEENQEPEILVAISASGEHCTFTGTGNYKVGSIVTLTCTPEDGYEFLWWNNNGFAGKKLMFVAETDESFGVTIINDTNDGTKIYYRTNNKQVFTNSNWMYFSTTTDDLNDQLNVLSNTYYESIDYGVVILDGVCKMIRGWDLPSYINAIHIPDSVTMLQESLFQGGSLLTSINIPKNITEMKYNSSGGIGMFSYCSNLQMISFEDSAPQTTDYYIEHYTDPVLDLVYDDIYWADYVSGQIVEESKVGRDVEDKILVIQDASKLNSFRVDTFGSCFQNLIDNFGYTVVS